MKNRDYKQLAIGECYHIYNRGNGKMEIFRDKQDYINFLRRLKHILNIEVPRTVIDFDRTKLSLARMIPLPKDSFSIFCYCLMPNHFHIIIQQNSEISISKLVTKLCTSYSIFYNKKYKH